MRIPARALKPLAAMAIAAASFGCIAPAAYAENAIAAVISDDGGHVVVDVDLNGSAPAGDATEQADMVKATVTAEKQRELYIAQQEAEIAAETKKVELAERQADVRERELNATVKKQAEADRYAAEQAAEADLYKRTKQAEATRLKGESEGVAEKAHGEGVAAGIKAQAEAYNGMDNPYLLANRYIDIMPKVAEQVAKPLTAVDSIKMYGSGNAQKLVKETTSIVDQVASGMKDSTGIDLPSLLNGLLSNPDIDADSAENSVE